MDFDRLFSLSAFEALRQIRELMRGNPSLEAQACPAILASKGTSGSIDAEAALHLHPMVGADAPEESILFYRECVMAVMLAEMPGWAYLMTRGRGRFIKSIKGPEYRDIRSVFRESMLLEEPPSANDIVWWDRLYARVRLNKSEQEIARSRDAERRTLEREREILERLGIAREPRWVAIEDNTVGYDVLSFREVDGEIVNRLIEVKSTIASPLRFILPRTEWDVADKAGKAYEFHLWDLANNPPTLHVRSVAQVRRHIPADNVDGKGRWKDTFVPIVHEPNP